MTSLLADIVASRNLQPEPVATDGLVALLTRSSAGRTAMGALLNEICPSAKAGELTFTAQVVGDHEGRPDIVGSDEQGVRLVIEAKFDAELTQIQLTQSYSGLLNPSAVGALVFLLPEDRLASLWPELLAGPGGEGALSNPDPLNLDLPFLTAHLPSGNVLGAVSWPKLLSRLRQALENAQEHENLADLAQIEGLVAWRSREGWTPLLPDDLPERAGRQLTALIHAVLKAAHESSTAKVRNGSGDEGTGRYMTTPGGRTLWVGTWFSWWGRYGITPAWAQVKALPSQPVDAIAGRLQGLSPAAVPRHASGDVLVPLPILRGAEIGAVITDLMARLADISARVDQLGPVIDDFQSPEVQPDDLLNEEAPSEM